MKKTAVFVLILALVCTGASAATLQVGATGRFGGDITDIEDYKDFKNYDIGADARVNLGLFGIAANVLFGKNGDNTVFNSIVTANLRLDLKLVDFAFGVGYALPVETSSSGVMIDGQSAKNFFEVLKNSQVLARTAVGVNLGGLGVSVDYKIPFTTIIDYFNGKDLKNIETFKQGKVAFSVLCNIF